MNWEFFRAVWACKASKGQLSPMNVIGFFVIIVIFASLSDPLMQMIGVAKNATGVSGTMTEVLLDTIPIALVLGILITLFSYAQPHVER